MSRGGKHGHQKEKGTFAAYHDRRLKMVRKKGFNTKLHLAMDAHGNHVQARLTARIIADCFQALLLLKELDIGVLLADRG